MSDVKCPICDAEPGEPCYDPHGDLAYRNKHAGRLEAEIEQRRQREQTSDHQ